jgi:hypothetical protein
MKMRGRLVKGSLAAKRYMAKLRKLAARKRKANPLTRRESSAIFKGAQADMDTRTTNRASRAHMRGRAYGRLDTVRTFGPLGERLPASMRASEAWMSLPIRRSHSMSGSALNPVTPSQIEAAAKKVGYTLADAGRLAADFMRTGRLPSMVSAQLRYFGNPPTRKASGFISQKISKLVREGYPQRQAIAIAHSMARRSGYRVPAARNPGADNPDAMSVARAFVDGATRGVASNLYIHGNRIYSYGPHFPIAEWTDQGIVVTTRRSPSRTTSKQITLVKRAIAERGIKAQSAELAPESAGPAGYSNPRRARRNIAMPNGRRCNPACNNPRHGHRRARRNPLLQTVMLANPGQNPRWPHQWVVYDWGRKEWQGPYTSRVKAQKRADQMNRSFAQGKFARTATPRFTVVSAKSLHQSHPARPNPIPMPNGRGRNPLTLAESRDLIRRGIESLRTAKAIPSRGPFYAGRASARLQTATEYTGRGRRRLGYDTTKRALRLAAEADRLGRAVSNPSGKVPFRNGQKIPVAKVRAWVASTGNRELAQQLEEAIRLGTKANKEPDSITWKLIPIGSKSKIDMVTAMAHYGDSPETYYVPPKGSKKGDKTLFRHKWESGKRSVPLLAAAGGKALLMPLDGKKVAGDWLRH